MDNKELKKYTYSIRLTKKQKELLKKNEWIKKELDRLILEYINAFL